MFFNLLFFTRLTFQDSILISIKSEDRLREKQKKLRIVLLHKRKKKGLFFNIFLKHEHNR